MTALSPIHAAAHHGTPRPEPVRIDQRHRVTATIEGFDPKVEYFEGEYEAKSAAAKFEDKGATATVEKVDVQIDDAGTVITTGEPAPADNDEDLIPF